jgi:hypothetical protein
LEEAMTVSQIFARQAPTAAPAQHPLVTAVLTIAEHRVDLGRDWDALVDAFGPELDTVAGFVEQAEQYECGALDHEVRSLSQAESEAARLRTDALVSAQLIASLTLAGA